MYSRICSSQVYVIVKENIHWIVLSRLDLYAVFDRRFFCSETPGDSDTLCPEQPYSAVSDFYTQKKNLGNKGHSFPMVPVD